MSLASPLVMDGNLARPMGQGDVLNAAEVVASNATAGSATLTAQQLITGLLRRTGPGGAFTDTFPDASSLINALLPNAGYVGAGATTPAGVQVGATFRLKYINTVAFVATYAAGTGVTLGTNGTSCSASAVKELLLTILNGTPLAIIGNCSTTNASAVVTGMSAAQTAQVTPGMAVSGTGISGGTTVLSVQPGVGVTLSANATATTNPVALTFSPRYQIEGIGLSAGL